MEGLLVFGRDGQVGRALAEAAPAARCLGRDDADLARPADCAAAIRAARPAVVVNAAAWTDVDGTESAPEAAAVVNRDAPQAMAAACAGLGIPFLHISTDYVFDGSGTAPWPEDAPAAPLNVYGATKLAGEGAVAAAGGQWAVLRTSWVFSGRGANFVTAMLRLGAERPRLTVVADQTGGPTPAAALAAALLAMAGQMRADPGKGGLVHLSGAPDIGRADFARAILRGAGLRAGVDDIASADWPTPAARPLNSRLDCGRIARRFGIARPDWRPALAAILAAHRQPA